MDTKKLLKELEQNAEKIVGLETCKKITWCGGCGNYGIQNALERALVLNGHGVKDFALFFDVGCNGNGADKVDGYSIHGLHGRAISLAAGASLANPRMKIIASAGDGATFSEGVNHLVHSVRSNYPMVFLHHNNENYGLTTGQASSLTRKGLRMNGSADGVPLEPINSMDFVLTLKPSFVARVYSGEVDHMTEVFREALRHDGFAFVEILQACPTYNRATPDHWYAERVKDISTLEGYDNTDIWQARKVVQDIDNDIYIGVIYRDGSQENFHKKLPNRKGVVTAPIEEVAHFDVSGIMAELTE